MTEDLETKRIQEKVQLKEGLGKVIAQALTFAVGRSRGAALVNMELVETEEQEIISKLPANYQHVSVKDILGGKADVPRDKTGLLVTGYSRDYYQNREDEKRIEAFVRATATTRELNAGKFAVLVLSDSLPNEDIFHNSSLPWFNGPFQGDNSVWSVRPLSSGSGAELIRHDIINEIIREPKIREVTTWIDKQTIPFEKF